jgi:hypothetical protein
MDVEQLPLRNNPDDTGICWKNTVKGAKIQQDCEEEKRRYLNWWYA